MLLIRVALRVGLFQLVRVEGEALQIDALDVRTTVENLDIAQDHRVDINGDEAGKFLQTLELLVENVSGLFEGEADAVECAFRRPQWS